jgi:hypothetical protein
MRFLDHAQRRTTVGRIPLDERPARRRELYLTTHSTHNRETSMPPVGFEPTTPVGERPQTYAAFRCGTEIFVAFHTCHQLSMHSAIYSHDLPYVINFTLPQNKEHFAGNFVGGGVVLHNLYDGDSQIITPHFLL